MSYIDVSLKIRQRTSRAQQLVGLGVLKAVCVVHDVWYLSVFAELSNAFYVIGPPWRKAACRAYNSKHIVCSNLCNRSGETFEIRHDIIPVYPVADNVGGAARGVDALQACLLINAEPNDGPATRAIGTQSEEDKRYGHSSGTWENEKLTSVKQDDERQMFWV